MTFSSSCSVSASPAYKECLTSGSRLHRALSPFLQSLDSRLWPDDGAFLLPGESVSDGPRGRISAVGDVELAEDVADVAPHRVRADEELLGDFGVGLAAGDEPQDFDLAFGEAVRVGGTRLPTRSDRLLQGVGAFYNPVEVESCAKLAVDG